MAVQWTPIRIDDSDETEMGAVLIRGNYMIAPYQAGDLSRFRLFRKSVLNAEGGWHLIKSDKEVATLKRAARNDAKRFKDDV